MRRVLPLLTISSSPRGGGRNRKREERKEGEKRGKGMEGNWSKEGRTDGEDRRGGGGG